MRYLKLFIIGLVAGLLAGLLRGLPVKASVSHTVTCYHYSEDRCQEHDYQNYCPLYWFQGHCYVPEPTATPTPTVIPTPAPTGVPETPAPQPCNGCGGGQSLPLCTDGTTILLPANFFVVRSTDSATLKWWPTQGDQVNIYYKELGQNSWTHAVGDQPNNGLFVVNALNPKLGYVFGLQQKTGCGGGQIVTSVVVDGPSCHLYPFSYWTW